MSAAAQQNTGHRWQKGQPSPNPGGLPKGLRQLQATITLAHGYKVLTALQALFNMGMDERTYMGESKSGEAVEIPMVDAKTRVAALTAFVGKVGTLSGLESVAAQPQSETPAENEAELIDRVVDRLLEKPETREAVAAKLLVLQGGKP